MGKEGVKTILVTGGAGFIGSHFIKYLQRHYPAYRLINLDKLTYCGNLDNLVEVANSRSYRFVRGDIADQSLVQGLMREVDVVVNFAAETHVDRSIGDPGAFIRTDLLGTYALLEAARQSPIERFIQISTDEVYGEASDRPCLEESSLQPKSPYAASKAGADRLAFAYFATYGLPVVITRCTNNYGPYQHPEKMIPLFVTNALEDKPLPVYGDGCNTRDWIHVEDHCRALDHVLHTPGLEGEVFNIGSGVEQSILGMANAILTLLGRASSLITLVKDRPGHVRRHAVDTGKICDRLDWQVTVVFEAGLEQTVKWYVDHEDWWRKIKAGEYRTYYRQMYELDGTAGPGRCACL